MLDVCVYKDATCSTWTFNCHCCCLFCFVLFCFYFRLCNHLLHIASIITLVVEPGLPFCSLGGWLASKNVYMLMHCISFDDSISSQSSPCLCLSLFCSSSHPINLWLTWVTIAFYLFCCYTRLGSVLTTCMLSSLSYFLLTFVICSLSSLFKTSLSLTWESAYTNQYSLFCVVFFCFTFCSQIFLVWFLL